MPGQSPKLLDQVRETVRRKHYSIGTEEAYIHWIKQFILFHNKRHPKEMGTPEIEAFLTLLVINKLGPLQPKIKPSAPSYSSIGTSSKKS